MIVKNTEATFARVFWHENGMFIQPINPELESESVFYTAEEINDLPVRILGVAYISNRTGWI